MGRRVGKPGEHYGRLVILGEAEPRKGRRYVRCECDCGTIKDVPLCSVRAGNTRSCGCLLRERWVIPITRGEQFGSWTVVGGVTSKGGTRCAECLCECGTRRAIAVSALRRGSSQSCGCTGRRARDPVSVGDKFSRWTVLGEAERKNGRRYMECLCECGTRRAVALAALRFGATQSCGCLNYEKKPNSVHRRSEYLIWKRIIAQCSNPAVAGYHNYGGRGIEVCERWRNSFWDFLKDVGPQPERWASVQLIDPEDDFRPGNARWFTAEDRARRVRQDAAVS